jgi:hypothetical protein
MRPAAIVIGGERVTIGRVHMMELENITELSAASRLQNSKILSR